MRDPLSSGGPYTLTLYDGEKHVIEDIWIGDVWVLGGQSNMELPISRTLDCTQASLESIETQPPIRMYHVPQMFVFDGPCDRYEGGEWVLVDAKSVYQCSAVGYFLAKELQTLYDIPIGLIHTAVGGTPIEAWMKEKTLNTLTDIREELTTLREATFITNKIKEDDERIRRWYKHLQEKDRGLHERWYENTWQIVRDQLAFPGFWVEMPLEYHIGSTWIQKSFTLDAGWGDQEVKLKLGAIIERDEVYVNGIFVGETTYQYPPRHYVIPPGVLHEGVNHITLRIITDRPFGGGVPDKDYGLYLGEQKVSLEGAWYYRIGAMMPALEGPTFFQYKPTGVYNGMIAPLRKVGVKGVAFYQGESNSGNPLQYQAYFEAMVKDWRETFEQGDIPFLYVQLTNYGDDKLINPGNNWAILREAQRKCLALPHVGMAVTIDLGEYNDLHPQNKSDVGKRLALLAQQIAYGTSVQATGPVLQEVIYEPGQLQLLFDTPLIKIAKGILGVELQWKETESVYQEVTLEGNRMFINYVGGVLPQRIRFGWKNNPEDALVANKEGLPASPFEIRWDEVSNAYTI